MLVQDYLPSCCVHNIIMGGRGWHPDYVVNGRQYSAYSVYWHPPNPHGDWGLSMRTIPLGVGSRLFLRGGCGAQDEMASTAQKAKEEKGYDHNFA